MDEAESRFYTSDLEEAAYITTVGYPVLDMRPTPGDSGKYEFVFDEAARPVGGEYYRGGQIEGQRLIMVFRELKGRLFRIRR